MSDKIFVFDTTLRDGEQSPGYSMNLEEKLKIADMLDNLGVDIIEAGFPAASKGDFESVNEIAKQTKNATVAGLCRALPKDIDAVVNAIKPAKKQRVHIFMATSPLHMEHKLQMQPERVLELATEAVTYAKKFCDDVEFSAEDATRSDHDFLCQITESVINAGATVVNIPDTVGYTLPEDYFFIIDMLMNNVPNIDKAILSAHCHNDLGLAVANSLAALHAGARQVECTINGIGERAGNAALEEIVMAIRTRQDGLPFTTSIKTELLMPASELITECTGFSVQPNKAIVGANAFSHESGVHQDGMLKNASTYEIMTPESVGRTRSELVLGKHSGRNAFRTRLQTLGFDFNDDDLNAAFVRFKDFADRKKKVTDDDLILIATSKDGMPVERIEFVALSVRSGSVGPQTAEIELIFDDEKVTAKAAGKGPVDACFTALKSVIPHDEATLAHYDLHALSQGSDATGAVNVTLSEHGQSYDGKANDTDVIAASCRAYINALNALLIGRAAQQLQKKA